MSDPAGPSADGRSPSGVARADGAAADAVIDGYLARLRAATAGLTEGQRAELVADVSNHLRTRLVEDRPATVSLEVRAHQVADELGPPEEIAASARETLGPAEAPRPGGPSRSRDGAVAYDVLTVLAVLLGGFVVPVIGWVVGVVLLWHGRRWTVGQRWLGSLMWPGGLLLALVAVLAFPEGVGILVAPAAVLLLLAGATAHLLHAASRARRAATAQLPN